MSQMTRRGKMEFLTNVWQSLADHVTTGVAVRAIMYATGVIVGVVIIQIVERKNEEK
jgi:hypothetical protein